MLPDGGCLPRQPGATMWMGRSLPDGISPRDQCAAASVLHERRVCVEGGDRGPPVEGGERAAPRAASPVGIRGRGAAAPRRRRREQRLAEHAWQPAHTRRGPGRFDVPLARLAGAGLDPGPPPFGSAYPPPGGRRRGRLCRHGCRAGRLSRLCHAAPTLARTAICRRLGVAADRRHGFPERKRPTSQALADRGGLAPDGAGAN